MNDPKLPFLRAIIARPDDDLPRLIFADWLDENQESERAEFVRVQCEIARTMPALHAERCNCKGCQLRRRERELEDLHRGDWLSDFPVLDGELAAFAQRRHVFRRGFVEEITCSWSDWQCHADAIRAATPLRKVKLTTISDAFTVPGVLGSWLEATYPGIEFELSMAHVDADGMVWMIRRTQIRWVPKLEPGANINWSQMNPIVNRVD